MKENCVEICQKLLEIIKNSEKNIYLIGINGAPGSGKSTIAKSLVYMLEGSVHLPLDGYHKYLKDLTEEQKKRRGSPETFDLIKFKENLLQLKETRCGKFPDFDHAKKDPEENKILINESHKYVIIEGLWIFLEGMNIKQLFDLKIYLECTNENMYERLIKRHLEAGLEDNEEDALNRVKNNDELNYLYLKKNTIVDSSFLIFKN